MMSELLNNALKHTQDVLNLQFHDLLNRLDDPNVALFVNIMMYPLMASPTPTTQEQAILKISQELHGFFYELQEFNFQDITNPWHFPCNWISELNNFIGNYFYDDAMFAFHNLNVPNKYVIVDPAQDHERGYQDPLMLIKAAMQNVNITLNLHKEPIIFKTIDDIKNFFKGTSA